MEGNNASKSNMKLENQLKSKVKIKNFSTPKIPNSKNILNFKKSKSSSVRNELQIKINHKSDEQSEQMYTSTISTSQGDASSSNGGVNLIIKQELEDISIDNEPIVEVSNDIKAEINKEHEIFEASEYQLQANEVFDKKRQYACQFCPRKLKFKSALTLHMISHSNERKYACKVCLTEFKSKHNLRTHSRVHNNNYSCKICERKFNWKLKLFEHMRFHTCGTCDEVATENHVCNKKLTVPIENNAKTNVKIDISTLQDIKNNCNNEIDSKNIQKVEDILIDNEPIVEVSNDIKAEINKEHEIFEASEYQLQANEVFDKKRQYACQFCPRKLKFKSRLTLHMISHSNERKYACKVCLTEFKSKHNLRAHSRVHNNNYSCQICERKFNWKLNLFEHMRFHTCDTCDEVATKNHVCNKKLTVPIENNDKTNVKINISTLQDIENNCNNEIDSKNIQKVEDILIDNEPIVKESDDIRLEINVKNENFETSEFKIQSCNIFVENTNNRNEDQLNCRYCSQKFNCSKILKKHYLTHIGLEKFTCQICQKKFSSKNLVNSHMRVHAVEKNWVCNICSKKFMRWGNFVNHMNFHEKEKEKKLAAEQLKNLSHSFEKNFICQICKKKFESAFYLKQHMDINAHNLSCNICQMKFSKAYNLKLHYFTHSDEMNFSCNICEKKFKRRDYLTAHMNKHKKLDLKCQICLKKFKLKKALLTHRLTHDRQNNTNNSIKNKN